MEPAFPLVDHDLARRIEMSGAQDLIAYAAESRVSGIYPDATHLSVGGGAAVWYAQGNIVNSAVGLGMNGPVEQEEVAALIAFFEERGDPARVDVCPYADETLRRWLAHYGFVPTDAETVLYQPLPLADGGVARRDGSGVEVRLAETCGDRTLWSVLEARGFKNEDVTPVDRELSLAIALRRDALPFLGFVDGEAAGTGMLVLRDGVAMFNGDSTLLAMRGKGVQTALLATRLEYASERGCDLAVIEAAPGGVSERNQQRAGFRVAYTRVSVERPRGL